MVLPIIGSDQNTFNRNAWIKDFHAAVNANEVAKANRLVDELFAVSHTMPGLSGDSFRHEISKECRIDAKAPKCCYPYSEEMLVTMARFCLCESDPSQVLDICKYYLKRAIESKSQISDTELENKRQQVESLINIIDEIAFPFKSNAQLAYFYKEAYPKLNKLLVKTEQHAIAARECLLFAQRLNLDKSLVVNRVCFFDSTVRRLKSLVKSLKETLQ